ncbi:MAG: DUF6583 family protein [Clostridia bacterium]
MKKKGLSLWIIILIVILILGAGAAGGYLYFYTDLFKKPQELFWKYLSQEKELLKIFENEYDAQQTEAWKNSSYVSSGSLTTLIQKGTEKKNINVTTATRHDNTTGRTYAEANLKNGQDSILTFSYINSGNVYAIKCEDILKYYIGIRNENLNELINKLSDGITLPEGLLGEKIEIKNEKIITAEEQQQLLNTYLNIVKQNISEENYSKSKSNNVNTYTLKLEMDNIKQILSNCLENAKTDTTILNTIKESNLLTETDFAQLISILKESINNNNSNIQTVITVYEKDGNTIKTDIIISVKDELGATLQYVVTINNISTQQELKAEVLLGKTDKTDATSENMISSTKIEVSKIIEESTITNKYKIMPNVSKQNETYSIESKIGKLVNGSATNTFITTINDENSTIKATYNKNINKVEQVEEIMELKNNNTIIINNYSKEQLKPFVEKNVLSKKDKITNKINQVVTESEPTNIYMASIISLVGVNGQERLKEIILTLGETVCKYIYATVNSIGESQVNAIDETAVKTFNGQFDAYIDRSISSANTKTLLKIIENSNNSNANDILKQVTVNKTKEDIETGKTYKVTANYNTNGFINEIIITEELTNVVPQV